MNHTIAFCIFEFVRVPNFSLNTILIFWTKFAQKWYFRSKTEKMNHTIQF